MTDDADLSRKIVPGTVLAAVLGVSDRWVRELRDGGYIEQAAGGGYELGASVRGYAEFLKSRVPKKDSDHSVLAREQAAKVRRENLRARGLLQPVDLVAETLAGIFEAIVPELEGLPGRLANELAGTSEPAVVRARLQDECRSIRTAVAGFLERRADSLASMQDGGGDVPASPEADPVAMGGRKPELSGGERGAGEVPIAPGSVVDPAAGGLCQSAI
jgi:hypothetical protein